MRTEGFFQVNGAQRVQPGRLVQRFGGDVDGELFLGHIKGGDRHAGAVERNAVAKTDIVQITNGCLYGQALAMGYRFAQSLDGGNAAYAGDDACEHGNIFAGKGQGTGAPRGKTLEDVAPLHARDDAQVRPHHLGGLELQRDALRQPGQRADVEHACTLAQ